MIKLTLAKLSKVAQLMAPQIRGEIKYYHFTKRKVIDIVKNAVSSERISMDKLPARIKQDLGD